MNRFTFQQQVFAGFIISLLVVFGVGYNSYKSIENLRADAKWVDHTREVIDVSNQILAEVLNVESSQRGYVAAGDERFLEQYNLTREEIIPSITRLRELTIDNERQTQRVDSLLILVSAKLSIVTKSIELRRKEGYQAARDFISTGYGLDYMTGLRRKIHEISADEIQLLKIREGAAKESTASAITTILYGSLIVLVIVLALFFFIQKTFNGQKEAEQKVLENNGKLELLSAENERRNWLLTGSGIISENLRGEASVSELCRKLITALADYSGAQIGAFYLAKDDGTLKLEATFAYDLRRGNKNFIKAGEGLIGQAALEKKTIVFSDVPKDYIHISSALGEVTPTNIIISPCVSDGEVKAVIELGFTNALTRREKDFLDAVTENIGITLTAAQAGEKLRELFEKTQQQAEELEAQQEELRITNEELYKQTQLLQASEEELRVQQEELKQANVELEEKARLLEEQNKAIDQAREAIVLKADELELTSKYKSEFLANMSHELRTPLNSILILARMLSENKHQHMTDDEIKYATVIYNAGNDLLTLINDILDLSKIEAGKIDLSIEEFELAQVKVDLNLLFAEVARTKKINFAIEINENTPKHMVSDRLRVEQILKNLLSNAFKFTSPAGEVSVLIARAPSSVKLKHEKLQKGINIAVSVKDSGIGISLEKQKLIFEAFQQADGSTSRKYGGTGLGLSISRELASILGGEIQVESVPGQGSVFTLYLPSEIEAVETINAESEELEETSVSAVALPVNSGTTAPLTDFSEDTILIVEDDVVFSDIVRDYAEKSGFHVLTAFDGISGLDMAKQYLPKAIILDIKLPGMDGWAVLKNLKSDSSTHHIPVHIMSAMDGMDGKAQKLGAINFLKKPIDADRLETVFMELHNDLGKIKNVLIIEDQELQSDNLKKLLNDQQVEVMQAYTGAQAMVMLAESNFDCIILDLKLPDVDGVELLDKIKGIDRYNKIPIVINTSMDLSRETLAKVMKHSNAMVVKSGKSDERLLDEVNLFFNKIRTEPTPVKSKHPSAPTSDIDKSLRGKTVLLVDDDMRNVFALSAALQSHELNVLIAGNGLEALSKLKASDSIDIVLMDIMMPEMDGYEAMQEIRKNKKWTSLPIIALTAKAMKNDREKCIEAGASDYISKPVDVNKLLSLMRVWISR